MTSGWSRGAGSQRTPGPSSPLDPRPVLKPGRAMATALPAEGRGLGGALGDSSGLRELSALAWPPMVLAPPLVLAPPRRVPGALGFETPPLVGAVGGRLPQGLGAGADPACSGTARPSRRAGSRVLVEAPRPERGGRVGEGAGVPLRCPAPSHPRRPPELPAGLGPGANAGSPCSAQAGAPGRGQLGLGPSLPGWCPLSHPMSEVWASGVPPWRPSPWVGSVSSAEAPADWEVRRGSSAPLPPAVRPRPCWAPL